MPRIRFIESFDWHVKRNVTIHYKAGCEYPVPQACADEALAQGKAHPAQPAQRQPKVAPDAGR